ncbi:hypothetical protein DDQ68_05320 [Hymenobacter nivis]|uniref:Tc1-like transposase DDE domain-containing protein n=1 Tax=Hymenobacter nivis TaxID=1850093 RepID=A0A2Z3GJS2_9BACT|nr:hypothetical protein DDQ68_05320 [Hymenobacter nivis]
MQWEDQHCLQVYFGDESGFCLTPCVPYGWQPCGQYPATVPQKSQRRNVFGLFSRNNAFEGHEAFGPMTEELLVACQGGDFAPKITQKTVVVLDNARFHHAAVVTAKSEEWQAQARYIWFLPACSPHLNAIETLWRKIKYEWLKPPHFASWQVLHEALDEILNNIGTKYTLQFT